MQISERGLALLKQFEGEVLKGYLDSAGLLTIGVGHLVLAGEPYRLHGTISNEESDRLLQKDVSRFVHLINSVVTVELNQNQFDSLVCLAFNIGGKNFQNSTVLRRVNLKNFKSASLAFDFWNRARIGGKLKIIDGLVNRRKAERKLFES